MCLCVSLRSAHEQEEIYKKKLDALDDNEHQIRLLRDEVSYLNTEKAMLQERYSRIPSAIMQILDIHKLTLPHRTMS